MILLCLKSAKFVIRAFTEQNISMDRYENFGCRALKWWKILVSPLQNDIHYNSEILHNIILYAWNDIIVDNMYSLHLTANSVLHQILGKKMLF